MFRKHSYSPNHKVVTASPHNLQLPSHENASEQQPMQEPQGYADGGCYEDGGTVESAPQTTNPTPKPNDSLPPAPSLDQAKFNVKALHDQVRKQFLEGDKHAY